MHLSALSPRYRAALEGAATALKTAVAAVTASRGGGGGRSSKRRAAAEGSAAAAPPPPPQAGSALVLNLGPAWSSPSAYALFDDAVIELPFRDWEGPPGLCSPPLDVLFAAAAAASKWLSTSPDAVALLCVRARSGGGAATARFVAACHSVYNVDAGTVAEALGLLPPPPPRARGWSTFVVPFPPDKGATPPRLQQQQQQQQRGLPPLPPSTAAASRPTGDAEEKGVPSPRAAAAAEASSQTFEEKKKVFSGPAQARYGSYFDGLLHSKSLEELEGPQATTGRVLRSVRIRGFEALEIILAVTPFTARARQPGALPLSLIHI